MKFKRLVSWVTRKFSLHGSWVWACKQMEGGEIIYRTSSESSAKYRANDDVARQITWCFVRKLSEQSKWRAADIYLSDMECTSWDVWEPVYVVRKVRKDTSATTI